MNGLHKIKKIIAISFVAFFATPVVAQAHLPNVDVAAGVFSTKTFDMCPGGSNGGKCDDYGIASCRKISGWDHTVYCSRHSIDYRTILKIRYDCYANGRVGHNYGVSNKSYSGCS